MKVMTFGYSVEDASNKLDHLMADKRAFLVDIRITNKAVNKPAWSMASLQARYGKRRYVWIQDLGNENVFIEKGNIKIHNLQAGIARLVKGLQQGYILILLCTCAHYESCHRRVVVEALRQVMPQIEVVCIA